MNTHKTFRHGQILRLVSDRRIANQEELRRGLAAQKLRVTQATLSRDLQELRLIKTQEGYKPAAALPEESAPLPPLARALGEFLLDIRPAENLLVLKTPPSGAQPLAAAVDGAKFTEIAGTIAGDDTVLIITPNKKSRESLQKKIEALRRRPSMSASRMVRNASPNSFPNSADGAKRRSGHFRRMRSLPAARARRFLRLRMRSPRNWRPICSVPVCASSI